MQTQGCTENEAAEKVGRCLEYVPDRKGDTERNSASNKADRSGQKDKRYNQPPKKATKWTMTLKLDRKYELLTY